MFTGERYPEQTAIDARYRNLAARHEWEVFVVDLVIQQLVQQIAGQRASNGKLCPLLGNRDEIHIQFGAQRLMNEFQMAHHFARSGSCGGHHEVVFAKPCRGAVIHHMPVFAQHQTVTGAAHLEGREHVCVDEIKEFSRVRSLYVDLTECGHVTNTNLAPHHVDLSVTGFAPGFLSRSREVAGAIPQPCLDHWCATFGGCFVRRGEPFSGKALALRPGCHGSDRDRHERWTEGGGAGFGNATTCGIGQHRQRTDVGVLALIRCHTLRGIALHMFRRAVALCRRQLDIRAGDMLLIIQPGAPLTRHCPERGNIIWGILGLWQFRAGI